MCACFASCCDCSFLEFECGVVMLCFLNRIVNLLSRRPFFFSPENAKRSFWKSQGHEHFDGAPQQAAPATRRRAPQPTPQQSSVPPPPGSAPVQVWSTWPGPPQETPREETAMEIDDARLLPEFDAVHAWTPRDRSYHRSDGGVLGPGKSRNVLADVEELETYRLSSTGHC